MSLENVLIALISGVFGGGLLYLAARSKTKADVQIALAKVDADHETEGRSVALQEIEASLLRLSNENKELREKHAREMAAAVARITALEQEQVRLHASERQCHIDLAFLRGQIAELKGQAPIVNSTTVNAAPAASTEGT